MIDIFKDSIVDIISRHSSFGIRMLGLFVFLLFSGMFCFVILCTYIGSDYWLTKDEIGAGTTISIREISTEKQIYNTGEKNIVIEVPDAWSAKIQMDKSTVDCEVSKDFYDSFEKGTVVEISYSIGRISDFIYCNKVL